MATKAYLMVTVAEGWFQNGYQEMLRDSKAIPEVTSIERVSGTSDLVVQVEVPLSNQVVFAANKLLAKKWVKGLHVLIVEPLAIDKLQGLTREELSLKRVIPTRTKLPRKNFELLIIGLFLSYLYNIYMHPIDLHYYWKFTTLPFIVISLHSRKFSTHSTTLFLLYPLSIINSDRKTSSGISFLYPFFSRLFFISFIHVVKLLGIHIHTHMDI